MLFFLPVLTGLLLAASFPRFDQHYLAWIAYVPLLIYMIKAHSPARAFLGGYAAGAVQLFALLVWMPAVLSSYGDLSSILAWTGYTLLILLLACFSGLACYITKKLMKRRGDSFLLLFPFVVVLVEFIQTMIPFGGFPWLMTGYSQSERLQLIQTADLTGVFGVSFLVVSVSVALIRLLQFRGCGIRAWWPCGTVAVLTALCLLYGRVSLDRWDSVEADHRVAMLQGDLSQDDSLSIQTEKFKAGYVRMADELKGEETDLVILPESPAPIMYQEDEDYRRIISGLARRYTFGLIFNNIRTEDTEEARRYFNSAYYLDHRGTVSGVYDKMHLVPFGEYIPMKALFVFMHTVTRDVGAFDRGRNYVLFTLGDNPASATICFEAIFPGLVRKFVRDGSRLLVNITNDRWYGRSSAPFQHFNIARWRAIENRRFFLRSANSGISAVIEPSGRIQTATGILRRAVCRGRFAFVEQQTFYTRYGDAFVFLCAIIVFGCVIFVYTKGRDGS